MKLLTLTVVMLIFLSGCGGGKYIIEQVDTKFSEDKNPFYQSKNNRISTRSIAGGYHIDSKGVYINPFAKKDKVTGNLLVIGLDIINKTDVSSNIGGPNTLGIIRSIAFSLDDGSLIKLTAKKQENRSSDMITYNTVGRYASYNKWETGIVTLTKQQFLKLSSAKRLSCQIVGSKRTVTYKEDDITDEFINNIKHFYNTQIK
jgi:hypothetical protein